MGRGLCLTVCWGMRQVAAGGPNCVGARGCCFPSRFYAGFGATLLRDVPEMVIQFSVYEQLSKALDQWQAGQEQHRGSSGGGRGRGSTQHMVLGGAAGAVAALLTTPLDVIKTQMQCEGAKSVPQALSQVLACRGAGGLFAGKGGGALAHTHTHAHSHGHSE